MTHLVTDLLASCPFPFQTSLLQQFLSSDRESLLREMGQLRTTNTELKSAVEVSGIQPTCTVKNGSFLTLCFRIINYFIYT